MRRFALIVPCLAATLVSLTRGQAIDPADEVEVLRRQALALRVELAQARLELGKIIADLRQMREFMASGDVYGDIRNWQDYSASVQQMRRDLVEIRKQTEASRVSFAEEARQRATDAQQEAARVVGETPRWQFDYKIAAIPLENGAPLTYLDPITGALLLERFPDIDRHNIMVKGSIQNRSVNAWRYTFDVRVAAPGGRLIGATRYQTPQLGPNDLHTFELKIPVTDVGEIDRYQIGNIEADRAGQIVPAAPPDVQPAPTPAPQETAEPYPAKTPR